MKRGAIKMLSISLMEENLQLEQFKKDLRKAKMQGQNKEITKFIEKEIEESEYCITSMAKARDILYFDTFFKDEIK